MDTPADTWEEPVAGGEWFAAGRSELREAFLDEPDAVVVLRD